MKKASRLLVFLSKIKKVIGSVLCIAWKFSPKMHVHFNVEPTFSCNNRIFNNDRGRIAYKNEFHHQNLASFSLYVSLGFNIY